MIISSFQTQYGIRLSRELPGMKWDEFRDLLVGIGPETPLGRVVAIRAEDDREVLKQFSQEQHRIRNEWRNRQVKNMSRRKVDDEMESLKSAFIGMAKEVR